MTSLPSPWVPVSWGELLDKISILQIKQRRIASPAALGNITRELFALWDIGATALADDRVREQYDALTAVNEALWDIEDAIRREEAHLRFGVEFVRLARSVYRQNDRRAELKRNINRLLGSELVEEKSYWSDKAPAPLPTLHVESAA